MPTHVLTLVAAEDIRDVAGAIAKALGTRVDWLSPDLACDIFFDGMAPETAQAIARAAIGAMPIDLVAQPMQGRRKRLLVADMESTIIANEMLDEMADLLGLRDHVADITRRAMNGEIDFAAALRERVALFAGQPETLLSDVAARIRISPGARTLVKTMTARGTRATILVSGGFRVFTRPIAQALGFTRDYANELIVEHSRLAGRVKEPILAASAKLDALCACAAEFGVPMAETLAVGDGANDLPMLHEAGLGIAYHAKPHVREQIATRIDHADLTALLYLQGYRATEFIA